MFNVGNRVRSINDGRCYDTFALWVKEFAADFYEDYLSSKYSSLSDKMSANTLSVEGEVLAVADHPNCDDILVLVKADDGNVFLMSYDGLVHADL